MKPEESRKWAEIYTAIAEGKAWQIATAPRVWRDACEDDDPRGWRVEHVRVKPEPQLAYVATWFDFDGKVRAASMSVGIYEDPQRVLEKHYGNHTGFRIDVIERELP